MHQGTKSARLIAVCKRSFSGTRIPPADVFFNDAADFYIKGFFSYLFFLSTTNPANDFDKPNDSLTTPKKRSLRRTRRNVVYRERWTINWSKLNSCNEK